jgi:hypothetical protein
MAKHSLVDATKVILVTGERMESLVTKLYKSFGLRTTTFDVVHKGLRNEFNCYANFEGEAWKWKEPELVKIETGYH